MSVSSAVTLSGLTTLSCRAKDRDTTQSRSNMNELTKTIQTHISSHQSRTCSTRLNQTFLAPFSPPERDVFEEVVVGEGEGEAEVAERWGQEAPF